MAEQTLLEWLRSRMQVDCDTLDAEGVNVTQAIAYFELAKPVHASLVNESAADALRLKSEYQDVSFEELAVQIAMVKLSLKIVPHLTGHAHIQTNPMNSYSTEKTVKDAQRIVSIFKTLNPSFNSSRVCIKIPSTWEGLQACKILEASGIHTLATTLFSMPQAALAAEVGCLYIAPYVNELKVHFDTNYKDLNKALPLCIQAQRYYKMHNLKTQVLPASLTHINEILSLAGVDHITISPPLLRELADTKLPASEAAAKSLLDGVNKLPEEKVPLMSFVNDEAGFRTAYTRDNYGANEVKIIQAINIFCDMQIKTEMMVKQAAGDAGKV
ncbi:MAG: hypothetical protein M1834_006236 [Cirrosporium novae-zelandiae]|nr:MAG: hypothetical protein M1834_006236 [Cirrosporium novae-zelandiae]